jgi:hypothetical protein
MKLRVAGAPEAGRQDSRKVRLYRNKSVVQRK